ncbi:MAG TPA: PaaI family thioesterase [Nocardioidaceae bacterium]|nr:PaaI family thioesterase [Nocardioidaceae bacterium]
MTGGLRFDDGERPESVGANLRQLCADTCRSTPTLEAARPGGYAAFTLFPDDTAVLTVEYKINLLAPADGDHIEAVGTVLRSGRTLTVCQLEVFGVRGTRRSLVAAGQQTLIRVDGRPEQ